jgi:predicted O-methyltransferase YrrM
MEIDNETRINIQNFVKSLTGGNHEEIKNYLTEILSDQEFHDSIARRGDDGSRAKPFSLKVLAMDTTSCLALYVLCRASKPGVFVETGVAGGMSSSYILRALDKNAYGKLFSIDVP